MNCEGTAQIIDFSGFMIKILSVVGHKRKEKSWVRIVEESFMKEQGFDRSSGQFLRIK